MIIGEKIAMVRKLRGWKKEALRYMLRKKRFHAVSIEKREHVGDEVLREIESLLEVGPGYIKGFDPEATLESIQRDPETLLLEILDSDGSSQRFSIPKAARDRLPFEPLETIIELYGRLMASEEDKIQLLNNASDKGH